MMQPLSEFGEMSLSALQGRWLVSQGVQHIQQVFDWRGEFCPMLQASVEFFPNRKFEFATESISPENCVTALLFGERDEYCDPLDIIAWQPRFRAMGTLLGRAWCLGGNNIAPPWSWPLTVHPCPIEWLADGRRGIVIVDADRARWELQGIALAAASVPHGQALRDTLTLPAPRIAVPALGHRRAA